MLAMVRARLTYANVVATLALFVALGGSSYAAIRITGRNVKNGSLTGSDIRNSSLSGRDVKNSSLGTADVKNGSLTGSDVNKSTFGSFPPSGPAGGDLTGGYPNPAIRNGSVGSSQLANGSVLPRHQGAVPAVRAGFGSHDVTAVNNTITPVPAASSPNFEFDTDRMHDASGPHPERITARTPGIYQVYAVLSWDTNATGTRDLWIDHVQPPNSEEVAVMSQLGAAPNLIQNGMRLIRMKAGDYVQVEAEQNSGSDRTVHAIDFGAAWIGP